MDIRKLIGTRIAELRKSAGFTQEQLAGKMEISSKYLSSIERGKENPTLSTFINISEALKIDLSEIFCLMQIEDPLKRKSMIQAFIKNADPEQLKLAFQILSLLIHK
jgi:transcriptional regulator with XRE-family HTH domain